MAKLTRIAQLKAAGVLTADPAPAITDMIDGLTEGEFQTILSVHARLSGPNQATFDGLIYTMGF
jgi:hypothetical protein